MTIAHDASKPGGAAERDLCHLTTRKLDFADIPAITSLAYASALEAGVADRYCARHSSAHFASILARGVAIGVFDGDEAIGLAMFTPIDAGFALLDEMESVHIFICPNHRSLSVARTLFRAIRRLSDESGQTLLVHQISYFDALAGRTAQTQRVERLYKRMKFDGSYGITYACRPGGGWAD